MKISPSLFGITVLTGLLLSIVIWIWNVTYIYGIPDFGALYTAFLGTLSHPGLRKIAIFSFVVGYIPPLIFLYYVKEMATDQSKDTVIRGATLITGKDLAKSTRRRGEHQVTIAGVPVPAACAEPVNDIWTPGRFNLVWMCRSCRRSSFWVG